MKKLLILSLILPSIFLIGCGSGSSDKKQSIEATVDKGDVAANRPAFNNFSNQTSQNFLGSGKRHKKIYNKISKIDNQIRKNTIACEKGSYDWERKSDGAISLFYHNCINLNSDTKLYEYYNGTVTRSGDKEHFTLYKYSEILDVATFQRGTYYKDIKLYTHNENNIEETKIDGTMEMMELHQDGNHKVLETMTFSNLLMKNNTSKKSWFFKGGLYYKVGCYTQNHIYETKKDSWLIENSSNKDYWSSGVLYIDSMRYAYNGDKVTVTKGDAKGTFTQQELIDEVNNKIKSTKCDI
jgi:hypothetical protein